MQLYVHVHVGRSLSLYHSLSSLLSCFYLPVFFSLTYTSSIMAPSGLLFQSSIMNSSSGSPVPPRTVSLDQLNKIKQVNLVLFFSQRENAVPEKAFFSLSKAFFCSGHHPNHKDIAEWASIRNTATQEN